MDTGDAGEEEDEEREWQVASELQAGNAPIRSGQNQHLQRMAENYMLAFILLHARSSRTTLQCCHTLKFSCPCNQPTSLSGSCWERFYAAVPAHQLLNPYRRTPACRQLVFAPRQYGLLLSAASDEGHVYVWEADRPLAPNSWCLQGKIQVCSRGACSLDSEHVSSPSSWMAVGSLGANGPLCFTVGMPVQL